MNTSTAPSISFEDLYRREYPRIYHRVLYLVKRHEMAEDLAQETFLKAWRAWPPAHATNLYGWLYRIAMHAALDALRREQRIAWQSLDMAARTLGEPGADPQGRYEGTSANRCAALARLPIEARCLLLLAADRTAAELAQTLGVNPRTLKSRLSRLKVQAARLEREEVGA